MNLFLLLASFDSILYSLFFFSNIIFHTNLQANINILQRYIFYGLCLGSSLILKILIWDYYIPIIDYLYLIIAYPKIMEIIIDRYPIQNIVNYYYNQIINLLTYISTYVISKMLNIICSETINKPVNITPNEISIVFNNLNNDNLLDIGKILFISIIVYYIEFEQKNTFNTKIISFLYNKKYILDLKDDYFKNDIYKKITDPKEKLEKIISSRRWDMCFHPRVFKLLIHLSNNSKNGNIIKIVWSYIVYYEYYIMKVLSLYGLSSIIKNYYTLTVISLIVKSYDYNDKYNLGIAFICKLLSLGYALIYNNYIIFSLLCECLEMLNNNHTTKILKLGYDRYKFHYQILFHYNPILLNIVLNCIICLYSSVDYILYLLLTISSNNPIYLFGYFSNYNPIQLLLLSGLFYFGMNIYDFIYGRFRLDKIDLDMIKSYIRKKEDIKENNIEPINIINNYFK